MRKYFKTKVNKKLVKYLLDLGPNQLLSMIKIIDFMISSKIIVNQDVNLINLNDSFLKQRKKILLN